MELILINWSVLYNTCIFCRLHENLFLEYCFSNRKNTFLYSHIHLNFNEKILQLSLIPALCLIAHGFGENHISKKKFSDKFLRLITLFLIERPLENFLRILLLTRNLIVSSYYCYVKLKK